MKSRIINYGVMTILAIVFGVCGWVGYQTYQTRGFGHIGREHHSFDRERTFPADRGRT